MVLVNGEAIWWTVQAIAASVGISAASSIGAIAAAIKFYSVVVAAKISAVPGGAVIAALAGAYILANAGGIAPGFASADLRRKGLGVGVSWEYALSTLSISAI